MSDSKPLGLTLGPVLYNWTIDHFCDFYAKIADEAPVDRVVIGEAVCSKREPFHADKTLELAERLTRGGKDVIFTTLAMPTTKREMNGIAELIDAEMPVEVNDMAAIQMLNGRAHICGPFLNIYNEATLQMHLDLGATRVCLPPELPFESVEKLAGSCNAVEIFAFGRPPLAISARCYHARVYGLPKDACQFVCDKDPDGMPVETMDGKSFLIANGVQTMGYVTIAITRQIKALKDAGVVSLRLSPQASCDMAKVAGVFRALADETITPEDAEATLNGLNMPGPLSDGFLRGVPGARLIGEPA